MCANRKDSFFRMFALTLALLLLVPTGIPTSAAEAQPRASYYLDSYNAYVYAAGSGKVRVYFHVVGTDYMDDIGALSIELYESTDNSTWRLMKVFSHTAYTAMLGENEHFYGSYVEYPGTAGRYYKAYVCIWAGKDGGGDTRYFWTNSEPAS